MTDAPPNTTARQRSLGRIELRAGAADGATRLLDLYESGPMRLRFPGGGAAGVPGRAGLEAVLVNTAGGVACGDRLVVSLDGAAGADLVFSTAAAEKLYRSDGPVSRIENRLVLGAGARIAWLPQETIVFDSARVRRRFEVDLAADAGLLAVEIVVFGRAARGERIRRGSFEDVWRVRRDGRLAYADSLRVEGPVADLLDRPAIGGGARACATLLDVSPEAEGRLARARALLDGAAPGVAAAASAWNGHLVVRALSETIGPLRGLMVRFLSSYRGVPMPRVWQT